MSRGKPSPKLCEHCGAKMVEYPHVLAKGLVRSLAKLAFAGGGPLSIADDLKLTKSEYTNFGKLKYWELVEHAHPQIERGGVWMLTETGWAFLRGEISLQPRVWTYRNRVVRFEGVAVTVDRVTGGWKYRPDYARAARPHAPGTLL
jgi:hypothetical protein